MPSALVNLDVEAMSSISEFVSFLNRISEKWQKIWSENKVYEADPEKGRAKYFVTAAFMYVNSPMHVGHARTYLIPDILVRFHKMRGINTLYPMGFHYTGTPIIAMAEALKSGDKDLIDLFINIYDVPKSKIKDFGDPLKLARYFHEFSKMVMKGFGLAIDWRREFSTIDPEFQSFITWQFFKLKEKGYIEQGTHPVGWCPSHKMPVGMHDTKDDVEPEIGEFTLILFKLLPSLKDVGDVYLPAATLRPETVYGVTNLWINPNADYEVIEIGNKKLIVSTDASFRLSFQKKVRTLKRIKGKDLLKHKVINPITGKKHVILPADFVNPKVGSGIVMSVPAHAPYDYAALMDIIKSDIIKNHVINKEELKPIPLILVEGFSDIPAKDVCVKYNVKSQYDKEKLDKATEEVYSKEFKFGIMRKGLNNLIINEVIKGVREFTINDIEGKPVSVARNMIKDFLIKSGYGDVMYDIMNKPVYCRCGSEVIVKVLENQWFINYGSEEWKKLARKALEKMRIIPEEYRREFKAVIEWLRRRACARSRGLGTPLPWEKSWIIESLSDSTIYMAFYTVIHKIRKYNIPVSKLTLEFWDYVILGKGDVKKLSEKLDIPKEYLMELRNEFDYWYPLDSRHSAKDLIPNHLTFFIFNHTAIMPEAKWPKQIVVNGWVIVEGEKMSKSKRNILPLHRAIKMYGADGIRASLALTAEVEQDLDLREKGVIAVIDQLRKIYELINEVRNLPKRTGNKEIADRWILSILQRRVNQVTEALMNVRVREASINIIYLMYQDLQKYLEITKRYPHKDIDTYLKTWVKLLAPLVPHLAEELWHKLNEEGFVVLSKWPEVMAPLIDPEAEVALMYADLLVNDVKNVLAVSKAKPEKLIIYLADPSQFSIVKEAANFVNKNKTLKEFLGYIAKKYGKEYVSLGKKVFNLVISLPKYVTEDLENMKLVNEREIMESLKEYILKLTGVPEIIIYDAFDKNAPDYGGKKKHALPLKPGVYIIFKQ